MTSHAIAHTKLDVTVVPGEDGWPDLDRDPDRPRQPGLKPSVATIHQTSQYPGALIVVEGRNIRRNGTVGARSSRVYSIGKRHSAPPPAWLAEIVDQVLDDRPLPDDRGGDR